MNTKNVFRVVIIALTINLMSCDEQDNDATWVSKHGMNATEYQEEFEKRLKEGYRLTKISGYEMNEEAAYAAIWEKRSGGAWVSHHKMTSSEYQQKFDAYGAQGYRLGCLSGYDVQGTEFYAAIWEKKQGGAWVTRHGMNAAEYEEEFDRRAEEGYRLISVSGHAKNNESYYSAIWEKKNGGAWVSHHKLTKDGYQQKFDEYTGQGYRLVHVAGYSVNNTPYFAGIWEKTGGKGWRSNHVVRHINYQQNFDNRAYQGYKLVHVSGYNVGNEVYYAPVWENDHARIAEENKIDNLVRTFMNQGGTPGLQLAITKDERLVFAKGYGLADRENDIWMGPNIKGRIASVSKPITSVGILMLDEQRDDLALTDTVFGAQGILGTQYGTPPYSVRETAVTVAHLLEHTAGANAWDNNNSMDHIGSGTPEVPLWADPISFDEDLTKKAIIDSILNSREPDYDPGDYYAYSNFGYCLLGRVIEQYADDQTYEEWIQENVLDPCGIEKENMYIAGNSYTNRPANEMVYYTGSPAPPADGSGPYSENVNRMDAHGGWVASSVDLLRFAVRVDGLPDKEDIIDSIPRANMLTRTSYNTATAINPNTGYAKGWKINNDMNHDGSILGTNAYIIIRNDGYSFAIIANRRSSLGAMYALAGNIVNAVTTWPEYDKF